MRVASVYVPHGREVGHWHYDFKLAFLDALASAAKRWLDRVARSSVVTSTSLRPTATYSIRMPSSAAHMSRSVERAGYETLLDSGLVDVDAARWGPRQRRFTWWNHGISYSRNLGMRIDVIAGDPSTAALIDTTWIDHVERRAERPSDHAALMADFHLDPS